MKEMTSAREVVILGGARTAVGAFCGTLKDVPAQTFGARVVRDVVRRAGVEDAQVEEVVIGNIGTGMVMGLGVASSRDDLIRSFLEGVAFSYLLVKNRLDPGDEIREFRLGGGGTANLPWMQIMADTLNLPVCLTQNAEMGIIGAASLARHGESDDLLASSKRIMADAYLIEPIEKNVAIYEEIADRYFSVRDALREPLLCRRGLGPMRRLKTKQVPKALSIAREGW